ncbi:protein LONGIFOLIA 2-like [Typha latifolia]|uniref:protein LONGIFOLIA 2-like n=1 Tax=Typha latifolia TaxID=4733 RepID=UPI003C30B7D4
MSAKFLHAFADENPELQKQIGCMTGIFQMFDRQHLIAGSGRPLNGHSNRGFLPSGHARLNGRSAGAEHVACSQIVLEKNFSNSWNENRRASVESSRNSFSSSSCSSFSSLECNRSTLQEAPSVDRMLSPDKSTKNSLKLKSSAFDTGPIHPAPRTKTPTVSAQSGRLSLDFRDVVKDSINREIRGLSVRTSTKEEAKNHQLKHKDSSRPMQMPKSINGSSMRGEEGNSKVPMDFSESLRVLAKLKEAPCSFSEANQQPRLSYDAKDFLSHPSPTNAPRFSYDGREISRPFLNFPDNCKPSSKLRELPRLSLDSREDSLGTPNFDYKPNSSLKDVSRSTMNQRAAAESIIQQEQGIYNRPPSVVAKLMGLEALPNLDFGSQEVMESAQDCEAKGQNNNDINRKASELIENRKPDQTSCSSKSSLALREPVTRPQKNPDPVMRSMSNSRLPIEKAPWKQQDRIHTPPKATLGNQDPHIKQQTVSVYSEIEKRLKELEFQQSDKDLRALKHILDAMQAKGLLETKKNEGYSSEISGSKSSSRKIAADENSRSNNDMNNKQISFPVHTVMKESNAAGALKSPIVIMRPAKSIDLSGVSASSIIPLEGLPGLPQLQTSVPTDQKRASINSTMAKDQTRKGSPRVPASRLLPVAEDKSNKRREENGRQKSRSQAVERSPRPQQLLRENSGSLVHNPKSTSPRLQQRKHDVDRRSRPPIPHSESNKTQRQSANRNHSDSSSPRRKINRKPAQAQQTDDQSSDVSGGTRSLSYQGDEMSLRSDSNISLASQEDMEVTSADKSAEMNISFFQQGSQSPSGSERNAKAASMLKKKESSHYLNEDLSAKELATVVPEQPSPISVLDASFSQDDLRRPMSKTSSAFRDNEYQNSEYCWKPADLPDNAPRRLSTEFNHKKLENIENLVQKLRQLSLTNEEVPATDHIASLCKTQGSVQNTDQRYVSEILLASGLLVKDLSSGETGSTPIQLHPSGYPINPDLFLVLEQRKSGWLAKPANMHQNINRSKYDPNKLHRKLIFDMVNELLTQKLELTSLGFLPGQSCRAKNLAQKFPSGLHLLKELCSEIEQLKNEKGSCNDDRNMLSGQVVLRKSEGWTNFGREIPPVVLDIERSIFKELIDEVITGEAVSGLQAKASRQRRKLFH